MYEKIIEWTFRIVFISGLVILIISGTNSRNEYRANIERIDAERASYIELNERTVEELQGAREGIDSALGRIDTIETGINKVEQLIRSGLDTTTGIGITSDRNVRLLEELRSRTSEGKE